MCNRSIPTFMLLLDSSSSSLVLSQSSHFCEKPPCQDSQDFFFWPSFFLLSDPFSRCLSSYPSLVFLNDSSVVSLLAFNFRVVWAGTLLLWFNFITSSPKGPRSPVMFLQHSWLPGDSVSYSRLLKMYLKIYEPYSTMTYPQIIWFKAKSLFLLYTF